MLPLCLKCFQIAACKLLAALHRLDPTVVRLRDPHTRPIWKIAIVVQAIVLLIAAVSLAAAHNEPQQKPPTPPETLVPTAAEPEVPIERHPHFYDPVYLFVEKQAQRVSAYPLTTPPGLVIDLIGAPEPSDLLFHSVGKDDRIRSVRCRPTKQGLRYVLSLTTPIKRIEVVHEGQVIMIFPIS